MAKSKKEKKKITKTASEIAEQISILKEQIIEVQNNARQKRRELTEEISTLRQELLELPESGIKCKCINIEKLNATTARCTNKDCGKIFSIHAK